MNRVVDILISNFNKKRKSWVNAISKRDKHVLFIEASREFEDEKNKTASEKKIFK